MPCAALARGIRATVSMPGFATPSGQPNPFNDAIQNSPCGRATALSVGGVDVSAENLCLAHWGQAHGLLDQKLPYDTAVRAVAGVPGTWTPTGGTVPASPAAVIAGTPNPITASPLTAWTTGQYVQTLTAGAPGRVYWNGTAWVAGTAP
jgi:hypothetical protein